VAVGEHVAREPGPEQRDHGAAAVLRVDAGASHFDHAAANVPQPDEVEFGFRVVAADPARRLRREHAVGAEHLAAVLVAHDQVLAIRVEHVLVDARHARAQARAELLGEHAPAQRLRRAAHLLRARKPHLQPVPARRAGPRLPQQRIVDPVHAPTSIRLVRRGAL
jgi:hypothetical protein